ncbi:MAG: OmpA family protein [Alphaproteobacteria bacterium]|nr:OmpA family protein [Alphaproteobacteria bacterium]
MKRTLITFLLFAFVAPAFAEDATYEGEDLEEINVVAEAPAPTRLQIKDVPANIPETINYTPPAQPQQNTTQKSDTSDNDEDNDSNGNGSNNQDLQQLQANSDAAHENETSLKNKLIGAAGIGVTGIGGMMIGEALSEQNADRNIENEMGAYINTFRCEYGNYPAVAGGKTNIELPGGNELFNLYAQYATLSNDLKVRKEALGIKPGIESEVVWDKAETGLYDDVGTGIVAGSYASVARALLLGGADAAAWAAQKNATAEKLQTGIIVAGAGAIGSALANTTVNNPNKKRTDKIEPLENLEQQINSLPQQTAVCPSNASGTYPHCKCTDNHQYFNDKENKCETCTGGRIADETGSGCKCQNDDEAWYQNKCVPVNNHQGCSLEGIDKTDTEHLHIEERNGCKPTCSDGFDPVTQDGITSCQCQQPKRVNNGICGAPDEPQEDIFHNREAITITGEANLDSGAMFEINESVLVDEAKKILTDFINTIDDSKAYKECVITGVEGYTDPVGTDKRNQTLSEERATEVYNFMKSTIDKKADTIFKLDDGLKPIGHGENQCSCRAGYMTGTGNEACFNKTEGDNLIGETNYPPCRRVKVSLKCSYSQTEVTEETIRLINGTDAGGATVFQETLDQINNNKI